MLPFLALFTGKKMSEKGEKGRKGGGRQSSFSPS